MRLPATHPQSNGQGLHRPPPLPAPPSRTGDTPPPMEVTPHKKESAQESPAKIDFLKHRSYSGDRSRTSSIHTVQEDSSRSSNTLSSASSDSVETKSPEVSTQFTPSADFGIRYRADDSKYRISENGQSKNFELCSASSLFEAAPFRHTVVEVDLNQIREFESPDWKGDTKFEASSGGTTKVQNNWDYRGAPRQTIRNTLNTLIKTAPVGSFLIRERHSESASWALHLKKKSKECVTHAIDLSIGISGEYRYRLRIDGGSNLQYFTSIEKLVQYYEECERPELGNVKLLSVSNIEMI